MTKRFAGSCNSPVVTHRVCGVGHQPLVLLEIHPTMSPALDSVRDPTSVDKIDGLGGRYVWSNRDMVF